MRLLECWETTAWLLCLGGVVDGLQTNLSPPSAQAATFCYNVTNNTYLCCTQTQHIQCAVCMQNIIWFKRILILER